MVCSGFQDTILLAATFNSWTGRDDSAPWFGRFPKSFCQRMGWAGSSNIWLQSFSSRSNPNTIWLDSLTIIMGERYIM